MNEQSNLEAKLVGETARIGFAELQRFFAAGRVLHVKPGIDLIEAAKAMAHDDAPRMQEWLDSGGVGELADATAAAWLDGDATVWAVVVSPWVLVQEVV